MMNKKFSVQDLEPAEVNPAKLRLFAFMLLVFAFMAAIVIILNYKKNTQRQEDANRPPRIYPVKNKLEVTTSTDQAIQVTTILADKISLIVPVDLSQPQKAEATLGSIQTICQKLTNEVKGNSQIVLMTVNPEQDDVDAMQSWAEKNYNFFGVPIIVIDGPSATIKEGQSTRNFAKKQFRFEPLYKDKYTKKWVFPTMVALVDTQKTFRGRYDLEEAHAAGLEYGQHLENTLIAHMHYLFKENQENQHNK